MRSGPGTGYPVISTVAPGAALTAAARNAAGDWIRVQQAALPGGSGWVSARYLTLEGSAQDLPVAAPAAGAASARSTSTLASTSVAGLTGKLVFQERSGGKIYVYDLASGSQRVLTTGADPALSPDGRTVAFWRGNGADHGLYLIDVDGSERAAHRDTDGKPLRAPAWSPDGSKIVFSHVVGERRCRYVGLRHLLARYLPLQSSVRAQDDGHVGTGARRHRDGGSYQDLAAVADALTPSWAERGIFYGGSGLQVTQDVSDESQNRTVLGEYRYQDPAAQPGGDRIVFHSLEKDHWEIYHREQRRFERDGADPAGDNPVHAIAAQRRAGLEPGWAAHRFSEQSDRSVEVLGDEPGWQRPAPTARGRAHRVQLSGRTGRELGEVGAGTGRR